MIDTTKLKAINIKDIWQALGYELPRGNSNARCFGVTHKNGDRNPSMGLDTKTNRYKCFACGISGDGIELVKQARGLDFRGATEWLSDAFRVDISQNNKKPTQSYIDRQNTPIKPVNSYKQEPIRNASHSYELPEHITIYRAFYGLTAEPNKDLKAFWSERGLSDELLKQAGWRSITKDTYLKLAKQFSTKELIDAGLLTELPNGEIKPLFYKHTVAVPFFDIDELIYLRARTLDPTVKAKYLAPRNTSPPIYNYQAIASYDGNQPLYITESETDALALTEMGKTAIALVGGQKHPDSLVVREAMHLITKGLSKKLNIRIVTDRDSTGEQFFTNIAKALYLSGIASDRIEMYQSKPQYKDISEQLKSERQNND